MSTATKSSGLRSANERPLGFTYITLLPGNLALVFPPGPQASLRSYMSLEYFISSALSLLDSLRPLNAFHSTREWAPS